MTHLDQLLQGVHPQELALQEELFAVALLYAGGCSLPRSLVFLGRLTLGRIRRQGDVGVEGAEEAGLGTGYGGSVLTDQGYHAFGVNKIFSLI